MSMKADAARLIAVWAALMGLLALTVAGSFFSLGAGNAVLGIGIAVAKAALILWFFMHLRREAPLVRIAAVGTVVWISTMLILISADLLTR
ncbi:cytochrome c oxidase subunit 4 [Constrictibacter sp. MBR-5]|jgi:cytochrome c oxidase subunit 4